MINGKVHSVAVRDVLLIKWKLFKLFVAVCRKPFEVVTKLTRLTAQFSYVRYHGNLNNSTLGKDKTSNIHV